MNEAFTFTCTCTCTCMSLFIRRVGEEDAFGASERLERRRHVCRVVVRLLVVAGPRRELRAAESTAEQCALVFEPNGTERHGALEECVCVCVCEREREREGGRERGRK